jgi:hypothetical protein
MQSCCLTAYGRQLPLDLAGFWLSECPELVQAASEPELV